MISPKQILALIAGALAILSLIGLFASAVLIPVAVLLLAITVFLP